MTQIQFRLRLQRALLRLGEAVSTAAEGAAPDLREAVQRLCSSVPQHGSFSFVLL